jgi:hypothetical protein
MTLFMLSLGLLLATVKASHLAYGTLSWTKRENPWEYSVFVQLSFRTGYFQSAQYAVQEGVPFTESDASVSPVLRLAYQPEDCAPGCGAECQWEDNDVLTENPEERPPRKCTHTYEQLHFAQDNWQSEFTPVIIYTSDDYFTAEYTLNITIPDLTLGSWVARDSRWWFYVFAYSRIDTLNQISMIDGNGGGAVAFELDTILDPAYSSSPVAIGLPRETAAVGVEWTFDLTKQSFHPENLPLTFTLATPTVVGVRATSPNSGLVNGVTGSVEGTAIDTSNMENNGIITWTPEVAGFYAFQVWVVDSNGVFVPLDFLIQVITLCTTS